LQFLEQMLETQLMKKASMDEILSQSVTNFRSFQMEQQEEQAYLDEVHNDESDGTGPRGILATFGRSLSDKSSLKPRIPSPQVTSSPVSSVKSNPLGRRMSLRERGDFFGGGSPMAVVHDSDVDSSNNSTPRHDPVLPTTGMDEMMMGMMMPTPTGGEGSSSPPPTQSPKSMNFSIRTASCDVGDMDDLYSPSKTTTTNLKYIPVDMLNTPNVKNSIAKNILSLKLSDGIVVIKHGE
jgi:hypothetical protein